MFLRDDFRRGMHVDRAPWRRRSVSFSMPGLYPLARLRLQSTAGLVRLCAETLDSTADDPALIVEVQTVDGRSMATLRGCVSALETISELRQTRNLAGLRMLQHVLDEALGSSGVQSTALAVSCVHF